MVSQVPEISRFDRSGVEMILMACDGIWEGAGMDYGEGIVKKVYRDQRKGKDGKFYLK